jgi:flagellar basal body-associated protein FliL
MTTSDAQTPPSKVEEIPLEDIDKILEAEDPEFAKDIAEVRAVEAAKDVEIEATVVGDADALPTEAGLDEKPLKGFAKIKSKIKTALSALKLRVKNRLVTAGQDLIVFAKTRPKEFLFWSIGAAKRLAKSGLVPLAAIRALSVPRKIAFAVLVAIAGLSAWVLLHNFKGVWLPQIHEPILRSFEEDAEFVGTYDPKQEGESFYSAFPQEIHEYLFPRMKVNLKAAKDSPNPMGAFEVIVQLDSKDTAVEVHDREVEFFDALQRVFEEETAGDLETTLGKDRLKSRIKRELNQRLTQGWVKDVNYKTFILKP